MANELPPRDVVALLAIGVLGIGLYAAYDNGAFKGDTPTKADVASPLPPPRTDDDAGDGEQVVLETIDTPATAHFVSSNVIAREGAWRMVHVVVDAQNHFGAMLRKSLCVTYFRDGTKIRWGNTFGVQECSKPPSDPEIALLKSLNNWPGTDRKQ